MNSRLTKQSSWLLPTLKEAPKDAETISHKLMVRAGLIRKVASGIYDLLPTGLKIVRKFETIVRQRMNDAGAQETLLPAVIPAELWKESDRYDKYGPELLRFKDRHERDFILGPTHEEVITDIVRGTLRSYKQLPINLYQIQAKFRDEIRPRFGVMRGREFIMKDAYSFHCDEHCLDTEYTNMEQTYRSIFDAAQLDYVVVDADSGNIGGSRSQEFMVLAESGEDDIAACSNCGYGANTEKATFQMELRDAVKGTPAEIATPNAQSIAEVSEFLDIKPAETVKALMFKNEKGPLMVLIRGDRNAQEVKLLNETQSDWIEGLETAEIEQLGLPVGFLGPWNLPESVELYVDRTVESIELGVYGANKQDAHVQAVGFSDLPAHTLVDIAEVIDGDLCPTCGNPLAIKRGIEVGHIFKLGSKYSEAMNCSVLDSNGKDLTLTMGCYGIGVTRTIAAAIEQNNDDRGIVWPWSLAPWHIHLLLLDPKDERVSDLVERFVEFANRLDLDILVDDRKERPGVKFADSDLVGVPIQVIIGKKSLDQGTIELKLRKSGEKNSIALDAFESEIEKLCVEAQKNGV